MGACSPKMPPSAAATAMRSFAEHVFHWHMRYTWSKCLKNVNRYRQRRYLKVNIYKECEQILQRILFFGQNMRIM